MYHTAFWPKEPPLATYVLPGPSVGRPFCGSIEPFAPWRIVPIWACGQAAVSPACIVVPAVLSVSMLSCTIDALPFAHTFWTRASLHALDVQNCFPPHVVPHAPQFCGSLA